MLFSRVPIELVAALPFATAFPYQIIGVRDDSAQDCELGARKYYCQSYTI
jgi:hypothetical protein